MSRTLLLLPALILMLGTAAVPGAAQEASCRLIEGADTPDDPSDDVSVCRQDAWFHQAGTKAGNLAGVDQDEFPSWNTTKPTASVTTGAGGGYAATSALHQLVAPWDTRATPTFDGGFTGNIDNIAVTMYAFARGQDDGTLRVDARLVVDGEEVAGLGSVGVPLTPGGQAAQKIQFAIVNLYPILESLGLDGADREHDIRLQLHGTGIGTDAGVFVYDTSEVPSGVVFNIEPENLSGYTVVPM